MATLQKYPRDGKENETRAWRIEELEHGSENPKTVPWNTKLGENQGKKPGESGDLGDRNMGFGYGRVGPSATVILPS